MMWIFDMIENLKNKIHLGDCLDFMRQMPDKCVDLVLTDPPYGIGISSNPVRQMHKKKNWDDEIPCEELLNEIIRVSKNQIIWGGNYFSLPKSQGFLIWDKIQPEDFSLAMCEYAYFSQQSPAKMFRYSVLQEKGKIHPTQKPVQLFKWCISKVKECPITVLDPFSGSGTTALACHDLGLDFICIEKDPDYHAASVKRLEEHQRQGKLL